MNGVGIVEGWLYVPLDEVPDINRLRHDLTIIPKASRDSDRKPEPIPCYYEGREGYIGVPIEWGLEAFPNLELKDKTVQGGEMLTVSRRPDPTHPSAAPGQAQFIADLRAAGKDYFTTLAVMGTGGGKTVSALDAIAEWGRQTLVIVHLNRLADQWSAETQMHLGIAPERIGRCQGPRCDFENKDLVIGISHSIAYRRYPPEFYKAFGAVIWDEVHRVGAPLFSKTLGQFPAAYKIALTATPTRKDGADAVFLNYFGGPRVVAEKQAGPMRLYVIPYHAKRQVFGNHHGVIMKYLGLDKERNNLVVRIVHKLYEHDRNILLMFDGVEHAERIKRALIRSGLPGTLIGQYTGTYIDGYKKVLNAYGNEINKPIMKKSSEDYLKWCEKTPQIVLATYGMMREGIDMPRLDAGIDVSPHAEGAQVVGRIRRRAVGKPVPVWYTLKDTRSPRLLNYYSARMADILATGSIEVKTNG